MTRVLLASSSRIRADLLRQIGLGFEVMPARVDEDAIKAGLLAEGATPRDLADALAEFKARKIAEKNPDKLVIGCDQVLSFEQEVFSKPETPEQARGQLTRLSGKEHQLLSAVVIYDEARPVWRHVGVARLSMKPLTERFLDGYLSRNWPDLSESVGGYKLEAEGARLFQRITGDYFTILGLPLLELCSYLEAIGELRDE